MLRSFQRIRKESGLISGSFFSRSHLASSRESGKKGAREGISEGRDQKTKAILLPGCRGAETVTGQSVSRDFASVNREIRG
jgi:hypothetical protein